MAKLKKNEVNETEKQELPAPDLTALRADISKSFDSYIEGEDQSKSAMLDIVLRIKEEIDENEDKGLTREMVVLTIQETVAEKYTLKLLEVQNKPSKDAKVSKDVRSKREAAYVLVSTLASMAWPKGETERKKVNKYLEETEKDDLQFVKIREYSRKKQNNPKPGSNSKVTEENFAEKLKAFFVKAASDMAIKLPAVIDLATDTAIPAINAEINQEVPTE